MAKPHKQSHSVQPAKAEPPAAPAPAEEPAAPEAPARGWTVAILVWIVGFGALCLYELWTGMLSGLFRR